MKLVTIFALLVVSFPSIADALKISDAWIKNLPPVVPMRAGYLTIENDSNRAINIIAVESEVFTQVDIHESIEKNGMMSMQPLSHLIVPAGATVKLAPGGIHLMMMQPKIALKPGDRVDISLRFESGDTQTMHMTVRK